MSTSAPRRASVARVSRARGLSAGSSRVSAALAISPMRRQELGAHVGACSASGRASRAPAGRRPGAGCRGAAGSARSTSPAPVRRASCTASKPALAPQYGAPRLVAKIFTSSLDRRARTAAPANASAPPQTRIAGLRDHELVLQLAHQHVGQVGGVAVSISARVQRCSLSAMATLSWPLRIISMILRSRPLILLAQHLHLPLLQRHRALAVRAGELDRGEQLGVALEEAGAVGQVVGDVVFGDALHAGGVAHGAHVSALTVRSLLRRRFRPGRSSAPVRVAARPTRSSARRRASRRRPARRAGRGGCRRRPPRRRRCRRPASRRRRARSTRRRIRARDDDLHEAGVDAARRSARCVSMRGPSAATGAASTSATRMHRVRVAHRQHARRSTLRPSPSSSGQSAKPPTSRGARAPAGAVERHARPARTRARPCRRVTRPSACEAQLEARFTVSTASVRLVASGPGRARSARSSARRCRSARPRRRCRR